MVGPKLAIVFTVNDNLARTVATRFAAAIVIDEIDASFIRTDRLCVRQRDCSGAERVAVCFARCIRVSGCHAHPVGHGVIRATCGG